QWLVNSTNIPNATNASLTLSNAQVSQSGNYILYVTNNYGSTNSSAAVLTVNPLPTNCVSPPPGIVSWWKGEGSAVDQIAANHGMLIGNTTFGPGQSGQCFVFDGNADAISIGNPTNLQLQNFTIEAWVKRASTNVSSQVAPDAELFCNGPNGY